MSIAIDKMIAQAVATLGLGEPNYIQDWYDAKFGDLGYNWAWCNAAVTYWAWHSGNEAAVTFNKGYAYTVWHAQAFQAKGQWHTDIAGIRRGDIVFFDWNKSNSISAIDHVGIVESVSGTTVNTIEGNIDNAVRRKVRFADTIVGYGRPAYAPDPAPKPAPEPPAEDPKPLPEGFVYTVVAGDTLSGIAAKHDVTLAALLEANTQVSNPDVINVGDLINIPKSTTVPTPPPAPTPPPVLPTVSFTRLKIAIRAPGEWKEEVLIFQKALAKQVGLDYQHEAGLYKSKTIAACAKFQKQQGWTGTKATGLPNPDTLRVLASKSKLFKAVA